MGAAISENGSRRTAAKGPHERAEVGCARCIGVPRGVVEVLIEQRLARSVLQGGQDEEISVSYQRRREKQRSGQTFPRRMTRPHMPPLLTSSKTHASQSSIVPCSLSDGLVSSTARTRSGTASEVTCEKTRADESREARSTAAGAGRVGAGGVAAATGSGASRGSGLKTGLTGTGAAIGTEAGTAGVVDVDCELLVVVAGRVRMILAVRMGAATVVTVGVACRLSVAADEEETNSGAVEGKEGLERASWLGALRRTVGGGEADASEVGGDEGGRMDEDGGRTVGWKASSSSSSSDESRPTPSSLSDEADWSEIDDDDS